MNVALPQKKNHTSATFIGFRRGARGAGAVLFQRDRPYLAGLTSIFLTDSFFSVRRPMEIARMPSW